MFTRRVSPAAESNALSDGPAPGRSLAARSISSNSTSSSTSRSTEQTHRQTVTGTGRTQGGHGVLSTMAA